MKVIGLAFTAFVAGVVATSCTGSSGVGTEFVLDEFSITGPARIEAGASALTAVNQGEFPHTLVVTTTEGVVVAATELIQAGESGGLDMTLAPGTYQITCRIVAQTDDGDLVDHYEAGMNALIEVSG